MTATSSGSGPAMRLAALWGDQHARREQDVVTCVDERSALAVSAGPASGNACSVGPNEDASLVLVTPHAQLLAVVGGKGGLEAARAALLGVVREGVRLLGRTHAGAGLAGHGIAEGRGRRTVIRPWRQTGGRREAHEGNPASVAGALDPLLDAARGAVERTAPRPEAAGPHGETALSVALVAGQSVCAATLGDASVIRLHGHTAETLTTRTRGLGGHAALPQPANVDLSAGDRLVLVTDGFLEHLGQRWPRLVMAAVGSGSDPSGATSRLLQAASTGGSHCDVAVALTSVASASPDGGGAPGTDDALEILVPTE